MLKRIALPALLVLLAGCSSTRSYTFDVAVSNDLQQPITIWLTKDGPPYEDGWLAPEDLAIASEKSGEMIGGVVLQPGDVAHKTVQGKFDPGTVAVLRIYRAVGFNNILAISKGNPNRLDIVLQPGPDYFSVNDKGGFRADPIASPPPPPATSQPSKR